MGLALEEPEEKDIVEIDGQPLMMTDAIQGFSQGQVLDFINDERGSGFFIKAAQSCC